MSRIHPNNIIILPDILTENYSYSDEVNFREESRRLGILYVKGPRFQETFKNGKKYGIAYRWYESGNIKRKSYYNSSETLIYQIEWYQNGQKSNSNRYINDNLRIFTSWYTSGQKKSESRRDSAHRIDGCIKIWYDNGCLKHVGHYIHGEKDGIFEGLYKSGKKRYSHCYSKGIESGNWKAWEENGNVLYNKIYDNSGSPIGTWTINSRFINNRYSVGSVIED